MNHSAMQQLLDARSRASVANIKKLFEDLRSRGYSNEVILQELGLSDRPVKMAQCTTGLSCPDNASITVRLSPMERTQYAFFISHPEGIDAKDLWSHYDELLFIYKSKSVEDMERLEVEFLLLTKLLWIFYDFAWIIRQKIQFSPIWHI